MHKQLVVTLALLFPLFLYGGTAHTAPAATSGSIKINGTELYYHVIGEGMPILVLHGGPGLNHTYFLPQMEGLAKHCKLIFFDQRATGRSSMDVDTGSVNLANCIEDIEGMRKAFDLGEMNLMGHSTGGLLAMEYAIKHPDHLRSLILVTTTAASSDLRMKAFYNMQEQTTRGDSIGQAEVQQSEGFKKRDPASMAKFFRYLFGSNFYDHKYADSLTLQFDANYAKSASLLRGLNRDLARYDIHDSLKAITCPTLIIQTDHDRNLPESAEKIHSRIPNSKIEVIKNCGHFPFIEAPAEFFKLVADFVEHPSTK
jgi:proline iminopeptidase